MRSLRTYICLFLVVMLLPLAAVVTVNAIGFLVHRKTPSSDVLNHQIARVEQSEPADLVLLGDSTLNAAVDEELFSQLTGHSVKRLPLTGLWGYAGSLALLERLVERQPPDVVLIMHTSDTLGRETSDFGYFLASDREPTRLLTDFDVMISVKDNLTSAQNFKKWYKNWRRRMKKTGDLQWPFLDRETALASQPTSNAVQRPSIRDEVFSINNPEHYMRKHMHLRHINDSKVKYLERLAALCDDYSLHCFYAHGPIARPFMDEVKRFHQKANPIIEGLGLNLLTATPVVMDYDDVGDTEDHVAPEAQTAFTCQIAAILLPHLREQSIVDQQGVDFSSPCADQHGL